MGKRICIWALILGLAGSSAWADLVGYWPLDGGVATDLSGNDNHGTIYGSVSATTDRNGNPNSAMSFGGGSGDKIDVGNPPEFNLTGAMTITAWVYLDSSSGVHGSRNSRILAKMGGTRAWSSGIEKNIDGVPFPATIQVSSNGGDVIGLHDGTLPLDQWVHFAGVYTPGAFLTVYLNGDLADIRTTGIPASQFSNNGRSVLIGNRPDCSDCGWYGALDEVRLYNEALSEAEIEGLMGLYIATNPDPPDGALHVNPMSVLSWDAPPSVPSPLYDVYLGTDPNFAGETPVSNDQSSTSYDPNPDLQFATTYYWQIVVHDGGQPYEGPVWSFATQGLSSDPSPTDGAIIISLENLTWVGDDAADSYDVYLGTSESAVATADRLAGDINQDRSSNLLDLEVLCAQWLTSPGGIDPNADLDGSGFVDLADYAILAPDPTYKGNQTSTTFDPGTLAANTTYHWRIDEVNDSEPDSPWKGDVWSFTTSAPDPKPRVIVSSDIGGSDNDDYQSMVHYLVYADLFDTEGLVSSPPYAGRKANILEVIDEYETDYSNLVSHSVAFPTPQSLRDVTKQGAINAAPAAGYSTATEGSNWIIQQALVSDPRPLWILVWGSITDVAQAVHDNPNIKSKIHVYSVGSWNTVQDQNARNYLYNNHSDLWWIESDTTIRGMYVGGDQSGDLGNWTFVVQHVRYHGALGDFYYSKKPDIKMGDTPSVLYLLYGNPDVPTTEHWGGMFGTTGHGANFWTDLTDPQYRQGSYDGAKTVNVWRENYLRDWQIRMDWADAAVP